MRKPKFRVGQVVCIPHEARASFTQCEHYGIYQGFDDGRYHVLVSGRDWKVIEIRPLTTREIGPRGEVK